MHLGHRCDCIRLQPSSFQPSRCCDPLIQFLVLCWPPAIKILSSQLHNCNFATVINHNVNIWCARYLIFDLCEKAVWPWRGRDPQVRTTAKPCIWEEEVGKNRKLDKPIKLQGLPWLTRFLPYLLRFSYPSSNMPPARNQVSEYTSLWGHFIEVAGLKKSLGSEAPLQVT